MDEIDIVLAAIATARSDLAEIEAKVRAGDMDPRRAADELEFVSDALEAVNSDLDAAS